MEPVSTNFVSATVARCLVLKVPQIEDLPALRKSNIFQENCFAHHPQKKLEPQNDSGFNTVSLKLNTFMRDIIKERARERERESEAKAGSNIEKGSEKRNG